MERRVRITVIQGQRRGVMTRMGQKYLSGVLGIFFLLAVVTAVYSYVKYHSVVYLKYVYFSLYTLHRPVKTNFKNFQVAFS